jgi:hypothetical protein
MACLLPIANADTPRTQRAARCKPRRGRQPCVCQCPLGAEVSPRCQAAPCCADEPHPREGNPYRNPSAAPTSSRAYWNAPDTTRSSRAPATTSCRCSTPRPAPRSTSCKPARRPPPATARTPRDGPAGAPRRAPAVLLGQFGGHSVLVALFWMAVATLMFSVMLVPFGWPPRVQAAR